MESESDDLSPAIRALAERLRLFIRETLTDAEERLYKDGASAGFHAPGAGAFCGVFPRRDAVYLSFPQGDLLPDPAGLLSTSQGRHVALRPDEAWPIDALVHLLVAAWLVRGSARD